MEGINNEIALTTDEPIEFFNKSDKIPSAVTVPKLLPFWQLLVSTAMRQATVALCAVANADSFEWN